MSTQTFALPQVSFPAWGELRTAQPAWYYTGLAHMALMVVCLGLSFVDERTFNDVSVWSKPFKFALSLGVYFFTIAWFAQYVRPGALETKSGRVLIALPILMAAFEMPYITIMGALGEASHFNFSSPFYATMYSLMGIGAVTMVAVLPWLGWLVIRAYGFAHPQAFAIFIGLVLTFALGGGFGGYLGSSGGHWVNAPATDANGVFLFNWTREGGDLRVAHFFGMHAMQVIPLFALLLPQTWASHVRIALIVAVSAAFTAFTTMTFVQAIGGQPFLG